MVDFSQRFGQYSNIDLLKIINRPGDYQPEALDAARRILSTRIISDEDKKAVEIYFEEKEQELKIRKEKIDSYKEKITDFLQPIVKPGDHVSPNKWLAIFLVLVVMQYVYMLVTTIIDITKYVQREFPIDPQLLISLIGLVYIPFVFALLYRRKRWGWILLMADNLISAILMLSQSYYIFKFREYFPDGPIDFIWQMSFRALFIFFLWRNDISAYFNIDSESKVKTIIILAIIGVLIVMIYYGLGLM